MKLPFDLSVACLQRPKERVTEVALLCVRVNGMKGALKIGAARKGKTWDEIYGKEKADEMRALRRLRDLNNS
jgi:hypothetical protein